MARAHARSIDAARVARARGASARPRARRGDAANRGRTRSTSRAARARGTRDARDADDRRATRDAFDDVDGAREGAARRPARTFGRAMAAACAALVVASGVARATEDVESVARGDGALERAQSGAVVERVSTARDEGAPEVVIATDETAQNAEATKSESKSAATNGASVESKPKSDKPDRRGRMKQLQDLRVELAERELELESAENELQNRDQTVQVLQQELELKTKLYELMKTERDKAIEESKLASGLCAQAQIGGGF